MYAYRTSLILDMLDPTSLDSRIPFFFTGMLHIQQAVTSLCETAHEADLHRSHWLVDWHLPTPLCCFMWIQTYPNGPKWFERLPSARVWNLLPASTTDPMLCQISALRTSLCQLCPLWAWFLGSHPFQSFMVWFSNDCGLALTTWNPLRGRWEWKGYPVRPSHVTQFFPPAKRTGFSVTAETTALTMRVLGPCKEAWVSENKIPQNPTVYDTDHVSS